MATRSLLLPRLLLVAAVVATCWLSAWVAAQSSLPDCNGFSARCLNCSAFVSCRRVGGVFEPVTITSCQGSTPYCQDGQCQRLLTGASCAAPPPPVGSNSPFACYGDGYYPDPGDCRRYYQCVDGVAYAQTCANNQVYSQAKAMCVLSSSASCTTTSCPANQVGRYQPYAQDPSIYIVCVNTQPRDAQVASCPRNYTAQASTGTCMPTCTATGRFAPSVGTRNARVYYECQRTGSNVYSAAIERVCPGSYIFDRDSQRCVEQPRESSTTTSTTTTTTTTESLASPATSPTTSPPTTTAASGSTQGTLPVTDATPVPGSTEGTISGSSTTPVSDTTSVLVTTEGTASSTATDRTPASGTTEGTTSASSTPPETDTTPGSGTTEGTTDSTLPVTEATTASGAAEGTTSTDRTDTAGTTTDTADQTSPTPFTTPPPSPASTTDDDTTPSTRLSSSDYFAPDASVDESLYDLPEAFLLGATSSAYQTEGAWDVNGKGPSIQDDFYHAVGGDNGDTASDAYSFYLDDIALLTNMSLQTYHFSLSWSRLLPTGSSLQANQDGIDYYNRVLAALRSNNIQPVVTLTHWDIPSSIPSGWLNPNVPDFFLDYATFAFSMFGGQIKTWLLLHDPVTLCVRGYEEGVAAPGGAEEEGEGSGGGGGAQGTAAYQCVRNHLLAHARAYRAYRADFAAYQQGRVGSTLLLGYGQPADGSAEGADAAAAQRFMEWTWAWLGDPLLLGRYPPDMLRVAGSRMADLTDDERRLVSGATDFLGVKHSSAVLCSDAAEGSAESAPSYSADLAVQTRLSPAWNKTGSGAEAVTPWSIRGALNWVTQRYGGKVRLWVTDNGYAGSATEGDEDVARAAYFSGYLRGVMRAVNEDGCTVLGYGARSLTDGFEWNDGYAVKYGLARVDFASASLPRSLRQSSGPYLARTTTERHAEYVALPKQ